MSWPRGLQSAIFWYASCAPCVEIRYKKQRKRDVLRGRAAREAMAAEMPGMYRHPSPASTNPHWQTEIDAGPVLLARGGKKKAKTNGTGNNSKEMNRGRGLTQSSSRSGLPSSLDLSSNGGSRDGRVDSKVYFQRFQRSDEQGPLSVSPLDDMASNSMFDGSSCRSQISQPPRALMVDDPLYLNYRNPQINDLHPATITKISSKEEARWMMQSQPTADFMSGKDTTSRSRSDSGGSRLSGRSAVPLSREISNRLIERRLRSGDATLVPTLSRGSTSQSSNSPKGQNHDRDTIEEIDFALDDSPRSRARRLSQLGHNQISEESNESADTLIRRPDLVPEPIRLQRTAMKPQLSTIASDSLLSSDTYEHVRKENIHHSDDFLPERDRTARRSAILMKDDSLRVLQDLAPASKIFKSHVVSSQDLTRDATKRSREPSDQADGVTREMIDSWNTADFTSADWIHEHTKREVKHRWSMDI